MKELFPKNSLIHVVFIVILLISASLGVFDKLITMSWVSLLFTNFYLCFILILAAVKSDKKIQNYDWLPTKTSGLVIFTFIFLTTVLGFAGLFLHSSFLNFNKTFDAIYFSFCILTTVGDYTTDKTEIKQFIMWEVGTGLLLFAGIFGLLISRISVFKE
jgi:hypothetical protein